MTEDVEHWPGEFGVDSAAATRWVEQAVGESARFSRVLRNKLWGFTALFATDEDAVVLKVAAPPLFPAAPLAHAAAHRVAPDAVPELLKSEDLAGQHWSLFRSIDGVPARLAGAEAVLAVVDVIAGIQSEIAQDLPTHVPTLSAASVTDLLRDLEDQPADLVAELEALREQLSSWGQELDALVPLSLDHVDLHLDNVLRTPDHRFVILDWEEAVVSCPLFSFNRLRQDAADHGVAGLAARAYVQRLLPSLGGGAQRRATALARVLAPLKLAHEGRTFARQLGWENPHSRLTTHYVTEALEAASQVTDRPRPTRPRRQVLPVRVAVREGGAGKVCREILDTLPTWFGMAEANDEYIAAAEAGRTLIASVDSEIVGLLVPKQHSDSAAEVHLLAVSADHRRKGVGRALVEAAERILLAEDVTILSVKTLSARRRDDGYEETRAFYRSVGFVHLEEHPTLWGDENPALQMVKVLAAP